MVLVKGSICWLFDTEGYLEKKKKKNKCILGYVYGEYHINKKENI